MTPPEKPAASELLLASFRDTPVASCLDGGGGTQFTVDWEGHMGGQLVLPSWRKPPTES